MLTVFGGIYLFFLAESLMWSTAVIWRRLKAPKNAFELDHDLGRTEESTGKMGRRTKNPAIEPIPKSIEDEPSSLSATSSSEGESVFVISHKMLRSTLEWDPHRRRHIPSEVVIKTESEAARNSTPRTLTSARKGTSPDVKSDAD